MIAVVFISLCLTLQAVLSATPTSQPSQQPICHPTGQPTRDPSSQPINAPSSQPTNTPSSRPTGHPSRQPSSQPSVRPSKQPTVKPSSQPSGTPTAIPSTPSSQPTNQPTKQPQALPSSQPSYSPTAQPSVQPIGRPTSQPSNQPTSRPSSQPSQQPSSSPTTPTSAPSTQPSGQPSRIPSSQPSISPTAQPSCMPTRQPTSTPSSQPSGSPSSQPSIVPTSQPTTKPTMQPSRQPSSAPSSQPVCRPTSTPTSGPSSQPSAQPTSPTGRPTMQPSTQPTAVPSSQPSTQPTSLPTDLPPCPPGSFYNLTGYTIPAAPGFNETGYYVCVGCPAGQYNPDQKQASCLITPRGSYSRNGSVTFTLCDRDHYAENNGSAHCNKCDNGEVIGIRGSFSSSDCMNPAINFILGSIAFLLAVFGYCTYVLFGRLHRIAFQRKFRLIRKLTMMYGTVMTTADMINRAGTILTILEGERMDLETFYESVLIPFVIFPLICLVVIPTIIVMCVLQSSLRIIFNAMVLWRAYRRVEEFDFANGYLRPFMRKVADFLHSSEVNERLTDLIAPAANWVSNITINLKTVEVTCPGAQSPLYLFTNLVAVAVVILVIESDVPVFWQMMVAPTVDKITSMLANRQYARTHRISTLAYLYVASWIVKIPPPSKLVQYCMGFVVMKRFFNWDGSHGDSWVVSSANCNRAINISGNDIPMDSILAQLSAMLAVIVFPPVVYLVSAVLFTVKDDRSLADGAIKFARAGLSRTGTSERRSPSKPTEPDPPSAVPHPAGTRVLPTFSLLTPEAAARTRHQPPSIDEETGVELINVSGRGPAAAPTSAFYRSVSFSADASDTGAASPSLDEDASDCGTPLQLDVDVTPGSTSTSADHDLDEPEASKLFAHRSFSASSSKRLGLLPPVGLQEHEEKTLTSALSRAMRIASSFVALDWLFLSAMYYFGVVVFWSQRDFLVTQHLVRTSYREDKLEPGSAKKSVRVYDDAFEYDRDLEKMRHYATNAQLQRPPLCDGLEGYDNAETIEDRATETAEWKEIEKTLPTYFEMMMEVNSDMKKSKWMQTYMPYSRHLLCHFFPAQLCTSSGRRRWHRVWQTYLGLLMVSVGWWPKRLAENFCIIKRCDDFNALNEEIYTRVGSELFENESGEGVLAGGLDLFSKIDNNDEVAFGEFIAATITCRIALLQMIPSLTLYTLLASAVASTPLFVFDKDMNARLPMLLNYKAYEEAQKLLDADYGDKKASCIQVCALAYYIFINQSRLIQFAMNGYEAMMAVAIIFFPNKLERLIPPMVGLIVHNALLQNGKLVTLIQNYLFPAVTDETAGDNTKPKRVEPPDPFLNNNNSVSDADIALMEGAADDPPSPAARFSPHRSNSLRSQELRSAKLPGSAATSNRRKSVHVSRVHSVNSMGSMQSMSAGEGVAQALPTQGSLWRRSTALDASEWVMPTISIDSNTSTLPCTPHSPSSKSPSSAGQMRSFKM